MQKDFQLLILIYVTLSQPNRIFLCLLKTLNFILKIFALYVNSKIAFSDLKGFTPRGKIYKKRGIESIFSTPSFSLHFHGSTFSQGQNSTYDLFVIFSYLVVFDLIWFVWSNWFGVYHETGFDTTPWTQDVNWMYERLSDILFTFDLRHVSCV